MKQKIINILNCMVQSGSSVGINSFKENPDGTFNLETQLSEFGHETLLKYEPTGDMQMFRVEIIHRFGHLNLNVDLESAINQLLLMLWKNTGSFETTTTFIGAQRINGRDDKLYATLNSFHHFVAAWNDEDIAKALTLHFFDMMMGLTVKDTALTMLEMSGVDN